MAAILMITLTLQTIEMITGLKLEKDHISSTEARIISFFRRLFISYYLLLAVADFCLSQNLTLNHDLENYKGFCNKCDLELLYRHNQTLDYLESWTFSGSRAGAYCLFNGESLLSPVFCATCRIDSITAHSGQGMVRMMYTESCPTEHTGCTTYMHSKLESPMQLGQVYEVSMWIYLPRLEDVFDTAIVNNIGFYLSLDPVLIPVHGMCATDYFIGDRIPYDQWYELKKYIRALCPLKYLSLGAFRNNNFPSLHRSIDYSIAYYLDDISVKRVDEDSIHASIIPTPYCEYYEKSEERIYSKRQLLADIYFESDSFNLDIDDKRILDDFILSNEMIKNSVFVISGHTDSLGEDHQRLSLARCMSVKKYLLNKYKLSEYSFVVYGMGSKKPIGDNRIIAGRKQNRRATIQTSTLKRSQVLYREGLGYLLENEISMAVNKFTAWVNIVDADSRMEILHDPRLDNLKRNIKWSSVVHMVKQSYGKYANSDLSFWLDSMYYVDQRYRSYDPLKLTGFVHDLDAFDLKPLSASFNEQKNEDSLNVIPIRKYLARNEFPTISQVGRRQVRSICYIIIHSDDTSLMRQYLPLLKERCLVGEAEWSIYSTMVDNYNYHIGLPQLFGNLLVAINDERTEFKLYKMDDITRVNERRREIGLPPIVDTDRVVTVRRN